MEQTPSASTQTASAPVSEQVAQFFKSYEHEDQFILARERLGETFKVAHAASALALVFERVRQVIDYQEEQVLRRRAIERILLRRITTSKNGERSIAEGLLKEIIWAHYLDHNEIPEAAIDEIAKILKKYKVLLERHTYKQTKSLPDLRDFVIGVMATEIERYLVPYYVNDALVHLMYSSIQIEGDDLPSEAEKNLQLYIAAQRSLLKADRAYLRYQLLVTYYPKWAQHDEEAISTVSNTFIPLVEAIEKHLNDQFGDKLLARVKRQSAPFLILKSIGDTYRTKSMEIMQDAEKRIEVIEEMCASKYASASTRIKRAAIRSILYIFVTKIILAFVIELPYDRLVYGHVRYIPLIINVLFPPLLMFIVAMAFRAPGQKNTERLIAKLQSLITPHEEKIVKIVVPRTKRRSQVYITLYILTFVISFGLIAWLLRTLNYTIISAVLFFFFTSLVSFFAYRIQQISRELTVVDERDSFLTSIFDFFFLPFLRVGRLLSQTFAKYNIFIFIFDFILEAPLKSLVEIAEEWFSFVREKKEEVV